MLRLAFLALLSFSVACDDEPAASLDDLSKPVLDANTPDAEAIDASDDSGVEPDAEIADADARDAFDDASADAATQDDAEIVDATEPDATEDAGFDAGFPDTGILPDQDGDGIPDDEEGNGDPDGDGLPNYLDTDSDGDGIPDATEGTGDPDGDGLPNYLDTDSDGDQIDDAIELDGDPDGDGLPSFLDEDSDGDFIADRDDGTGDPDGDGTPNFLDLNSDGDLILDEIEAGDASLGTPPQDFDFDGVPNFVDLDSDGDTIADRDERTTDTDMDGAPDFVDIDSDNDSVLDIDEAGDANLATPPVDSDSDAAPDYRDRDADNDTIGDLFERLADTDLDGTPDRRDLDSDGDSVLDADEAGDADLDTPPVDTDGDTRVDFRDLDSDADGLTDGGEAGCPGSTERLMPDSDLDGFVDPAELAYGSDPCDAISFIDDFYFVLPPLGPLQDAPLVFDDTGIDRADLSINVDTTGSMGGEIANLRGSLSNVIIPGVQAAVPDPGFAVSSFEDYPINPFGTAAAGDRPFRLGTVVTTNPATAQAAVNGLVTRNGLDLPESGIESLFQIATGAGTSWTGGSVPPFGTGIGGVDFRDDSLPIVVHVTDAISHVPEDYVAVDPNITAVSIAQARTALSSIGARVITIANEGLPRPSDQAVTDQFFTDHCSGITSRFYGAIDPPTGSDTDWFLLQGAVAGNVVDVEITAARLGSTLDSMVGVYGGTTRLAFNDDIQTGVIVDSQLTVTLSGAGPFYLAISSWDDSDFNGSSSFTNGFYFADVSLAGAGTTRTPRGCPAADDAGGRTGATVISTAPAAPPQGVAQCVAECRLRVEDEPFRLPYGMSELTNAVIPTCAWDEFGVSRPQGCAANECCTGIGGAGTPPNGAGDCPLSFEIDSAGTGIDVAVVAGIEALVNFSTFTITTVIRGDPTAAFDTACFIHGVIPQGATTPNACAPTPTTADLIPPTPELDSFENVVPGTILTFQVNAQNRDRATNLACAPALPDPQLFRAFIDVVADGVTVVDTRDVIVIVPPVVPGGEN